MTPIALKKETLRVFESHKDSLELRLANTSNHLDKFDLVIKISQVEYIIDLIKKDLKKEEENGIN